MSAYERQPIWDWQTHPTQIPRLENRMNGGANAPQRESRLQIFVARLEVLQGNIHAETERIKGLGDLLAGVVEEKREASDPNKVRIPSNGVLDRLDSNLGQLEALVKMHAEAVARVMGVI
jgi:hypothetical protein